MGYIKFLREIEVSTDHPISAGKPVTINKKKKKKKSKNKQIPPS